MLVNLPSFSRVAVPVLAELHGVIVYFPAIISLRPEGGGPSIRGC